MYLQSCDNSSQFPVSVFFVSASVIFEHILDLSMKIKFVQFASEKYMQSCEKSSQMPVSVFSVSASDNLEIKCALYLLLRYPSPRFVQTDLEDLLIWSVRLYFSSGGNFFDSSKISIASLYAF